MPVVTIWMIRSSLIYLILAFLSGSIILLNKSLDIHSGLWAMLPVHIEFAMIGWVLQFVAGTAYWMFPRHMTGEKRGSHLLGVMMAVSINAGILLSAFSLGNQLALFMGRLFLSAAVLLFLTLMWRRVLSYREV